MREPEVFGDFFSQLGRYIADSICEAVAIPLDVFHTGCDLVLFELADQLRSGEALAFAGELLQDVLFLVKVAHIANYLIFCNI